MKSLIKQFTHWLTQHTGWTGIFIMAGVFFLLPLTARAQYNIGQDMIKQAREKIQAKGADQVTSLYNNQHPVGHLTLYKISSIGSFKPELEIRFNKEVYQPDDEVVVTLIRKKENVNSYKSHGLGKDRGKIFTGPVYKKLPVDISGEFAIKSISKARDKNGTLWMKPGDQVTIHLTFNRTTSYQVMLILAGNAYRDVERTYAIDFDGNPKIKRPPSYIPQRKGRGKVVVDSVMTPFLGKTIHADTTSIRVHAVYVPEKIGKKEKVFDHTIKNQPALPGKRSNAAIDNYITVNGQYRYRDAEKTGLLKPVRHFTLVIDESDDEAGLENYEMNGGSPPYDMIGSAYPVTTNPDGTFQQTIYASKAWMVVKFDIERIENNHVVYRSFQYIDKNTNKDVAGAFNISSTDVSTINPKYDLEMSSNPTLETIRREASIADRIDDALTTNVGNGVDLGSLQTVYIVTASSGIDDQSFANVNTNVNQTNNIQIGSKQTVDLSDAVIWHEYGHTLQFALNNFKEPPEAGGAHALDNLVHPDVAYTEGWADFWACVVAGNANLWSGAPYHANLNLGNTRYSDFIYRSPLSNGSYLTGNYLMYQMGDTRTPYDGVENEGMVASAFWTMMENSGGLPYGLSNVWDGMKQFYYGSAHYAYNFMEYLADNPSLSSVLTTQTYQQVGMGSGFTFVTPGAQLETLIPNLPDKRLVYISAGTYKLNSQIIIDQKSVGIYGESARTVSIHGLSNQNSINVRRRNSNNDWVKIADISFGDGDYGIDPCG